MTPALLGGLAAVAVLLLSVVLWPARRTPAVDRLRRLEADRAHHARPGGRRSEAGRRAALEVGGWARQRGLRLRVPPPDLLLAGHDADAVMAAKVLALSLAGGVLLVGGIAVGRLGQVSVPGPVLLLLATAAGVGAFLLPDAVVRARAARRRREIVAVLPVWCDLVALEMGGAAAPQEALVTAAESGTSLAMHLIREALYRAGRAHQSHWQALTVLGERIGVPDLADLGRLSQLVSHEGAEVRDTLIERAATLRRRALAESLGQAGERDESMRLAVLVIAAGVVLMMLYPGAVAVMNL
ncbi:hypothetical protein KIH74_35340 [Kineosporia sp. J2-2]|uniref:Flp pilus assembly protein TadB n=1 Tax=Kineosporia corallincola TaxID=2835133 RepID=A0ABS5TTY3_9ACTN|nr:hypothetical protein [Kineosporia corallincola]MBT0774272.1 hypothetical protein [Kineosporia corallincola]